MNSALFASCNFLGLGLRSQQSTLTSLQIVKSSFLLITKSTQPSSFPPKFHILGGNDNLRQNSPSGILRPLDCNRTFRTSPCASARRIPVPRRKTSSERAPRYFTLPQSKITAIFGSKISRKDGNQLLSELQVHREEGTVDTQLPHPETRVAAGFQYLQAKYPMDEDAAIIARIDKELESDFRLPQTSIERSPHAQSRLEKIRKENEAKYEREQAALEAEKKKALQKNPAGSAEVTVKERTMKNLVHGKERSAEEPEWIKKYRERATEKEIPQISNFARLFPSGVFVLSVLAFSLYFAQNYTPPSPEARLFPETPPAAATMLTILALNVTVYMLWRVPQMWRFMNRYFIIVPLRPRAASMLLAEFSHQDASHMSQMLVMWFLGVNCESSP